MDEISYILEVDDDLLELLPEAKRRELLELRAELWALEPAYPDGDEPGPGPDDLP